MNKIFAIAWKEVYTTFRSRNLLLIMFATPIVLSTIMGLVFGGLGGSDDGQAFTNMPIAVVNMDEGFNFGNLAEGGAANNPTLTDLGLEVGGESINIGEQLLQNQNLDLNESDLTLNGGATGDGVPFNFGTQLVDILAATPLTATDALTTEGTSTVNTSTANTFDIENISCPLTEDSEIGDNADEPPFGFEGTLADLFNVTVLDDPSAARASVDSGTYVAAVLIPAGFSSALMPIFNFGATSAADAAADPAANAVEVYGSGGQQISAIIVRAVVEGIVNQFAGIGVALESLLETSTNRLLSEIDLSALDPTAFIGLLQGVDASLLEPLGCLLTPNAGNIKLKPMPLQPIQEGSNFALIMTLLGTAQAIFVSLFTGIFGINSIYDEQKGWTLQRMIASPTPRWYVLAGKMLGNVATVAAQLIILLISFTAITSIIERTPTFIWGNNIPLLLLSVLAISLMVSGIGVFLVGLARSTEQVQFLGPMIASTLGALGGAFGFRLPPDIAQFSPIWWGTELLNRIANGEPAIWTPLLVLVGIAAFCFVIGTGLFKRRVDL